MRGLITALALCCAVAASGQIYIDSYRFGAALDADAKAFLNSAGITDATITQAINTLVVDLKNYGIWTKMKAIYPMVGGTADTHKWNLKDPRNLDAAFRLNFVGTWTHSSTGALPDGATAYANTFLNPATVLGDNSVTMSYYSRTATTSTTNNYAMGATTVSSGFVALILRNSVKAFIFTNASTAFEEAVDNTLNSSTAGFFVGTQSASDTKLFRNATLLASNSATRGGPRINKIIFIGAENGPASYSSAQCAFSCIGNWLTDTEAGNLNTAVQAFQTTLGRNI